MDLCHVLVAVGGVGAVLKGVCTVEEQVLLLLVHNPHHE